MYIYPSGHKWQVAGCQPYDSCLRTRRPSDLDHRNLFRVSTGTIQKSSLQDHLLHVQSHEIQPRGGSIRVYASTLAIALHDGAQ